MRITLIATGFDADKKNTDVRRQMAAAEAAAKVEEAPKEANTDIDDILSMLNKR
jgi:3-hydroxyisobutyrate dehydrogenase-like beta-hydroxyacid dehydrogenase